MKILVADDVASMRNMVKKLLREIELYDHVDAASGVKAFEILQSQKIDIILADWYMPDGDGLELLEKVRSNDQTKHIPFIMVTVESKPENIAKAIKAGANDYIVKPFTADTIRKKIEKIVQKIEVKEVKDAHQGHSSYIPPTIR